MTDPWTKGPWRLADRGADGWIINSGSLRLVFVYAKRGSPPHEYPKAAANACLIAAAPDLVEALAELVRRLEANGDWDDGCFYYGGRSASELQTPLFDSKVLLARVRGETGKEQG